VQGASLRAGLGQTTLRDYLNNPGRSITTRTLGKLAPVLAVSTNWLLTGQDESNGELAELIDIWSRIPESHKSSILALAKGVAKKEG
jgi:hypothetical protein